MNAAIKLEPIASKNAYEENVPPFLRKNLLYLKDKRNKQNPLYDCYLDEATSSINICEIENLISKEVADYLRNKFLKR